MVDDRALDKGGTGRTVQGVSTADVHDAACQAWDQREAILDETADLH
jgi:hypothetical protein